MTLRHWNDALNRTNEAVGDVDSIADAAGALVLRDANGDAALRRVNASQHVEVGTTDGGKVRLQASAPTAAGHLQVDPTTGRLYAFVGGRVVLIQDSITVAWPKYAIDAAATDETAATAIGAPPGFPWMVTDAFYIPASSLTANATNFATLTVGVSDPGDGAAVVGSVAIGVTTPSGANSTGDWVFGKKVQLTLQEQAFPFAATDYPTFRIQKGSSGVQVPRGLLVVIIHPWQDE